MNCEMDSAGQHAGQRTLVKDHRVGSKVRLKPQGKSARLMAPFQAADLGLDQQFLEQLMGTRAATTATSTSPSSITTSARSSTTWNPEILHQWVPSGRPAPDGMNLPNSGLIGRAPILDTKRPLN